MLRQRRQGRGSLVRTWLVTAVALGWALAAAVGEAQVIDTVEVVRDGANAVVSIRFIPQIQYLRHAPTNRGDLIKVYFQFIGADPSVLSTSQETRRSPPSQLVPRFEVIYRAPTSAVPRTIDIKFATPVQFTLRPTDNRTIVLTIPLPKRLLREAVPPAARTGPPPEAGPAPPVNPEVEAEAETAMTEARTALKAEDYIAGEQALNRLLNLPPNRESQEAQELIGGVREKLGEPDIARIEYELYLKLYPEGPGAARVRERLAALGAAPAAGAQPAPEHEAAAPAYSAFGNVSQFYYGGKSRIQQTTTVTTPATGATTIETNQLTSTDQSQIITTANLNGRWQNGPWDSRVVFNDAYTWSFLSGTPSNNKLNTFYGETHNQPTNVLVRGGRQVGTNDGILGRFDGGLAIWGFKPDYRLEFFGGKLVDTPVNQYFIGPALDVDNFLPGTSGQVFVNYQKVAGVTDRLGVGGEVRYFDATRTGYALFDYDPDFKAVNTGSFQGTWQLPTGTTVNVLADYRRTPTLQLANVVGPEQTTCIECLLRINGESALRDEAKAFTPISKVYLIGVTQPFSGKWQIGFDVRMSSLTGTPATAIAPATNGTGRVYTYDTQLIGTSLTSLQDILAINGSVLRGSQLNAAQAGIDYRFTPIALLSLEPSFKYYEQTDNQNTRLTRLTPAIRVIYQLRQRFSLEGEYDLERTHTTGQGTESVQYRSYFYVGWRWDF